jgi:hypothetical protein
MSDLLIEKKEIETIQEVSEESYGSSSNEDTNEQESQEDLQVYDAIDNLEEMINDIVQKNLSMEKNILDEDEIKHMPLELKRTVYCEDPLVFTIDNYLTDEECDHFINISKDHKTSLSASHCG